MRVHSCPKLAEYQASVAVVWCDWLSQHSQYIFRLDDPIRMDAMTFPRVFINQVERSQPPTTFRVVAYKVPHPTS